MVSTGLESELHLRWRRAFPTPEYDHVFRELVAAYDGPDRHYHNLAHVRDCLRNADAVYDRLVDPRAVMAAIFFHDAVYDPTRSDNEERSADLAERHLRAMGRSESFVAEVRDLILDTRHLVSPGSNDGRYLVDIDLAILGAPPEEFDAYERAIRREYAHVPEDAFRDGRAQVLKALLELPSIYRLDPLRAAWEERARANLSRELQVLRPA